MTTSDKKPVAAVARLAQAMVDDIIATSDSELLAEFAATHGDPSKKAADLRARFEQALLKANKGRLHEAKAGLAASRTTNAASSVVDMGKVRERLRRTLASCPDDMKLTLAARNESELTDRDVLGMLQDLEELGIAISDDDRDG